LFLKIEPEQLLTEDSVLFMLAKIHKTLVVLVMGSSVGLSKPRALLMPLGRAYLFCRNHEKREMIDGIENVQ
jgi:hypothetical protein